MQPLSRGSVSINSPNPLDPPVVDLGIFSNPNDLDLYISGYQTYIKALNIQLQAIDPQYQLILPDPAILDDTALLTEYIKDVVGSNQSFESHCRMAALAQGGVVDSTGRVYGVNNLFVADNSINPQPMTGSTMFTGFLNAENIVELFRILKRRISMFTKRWISYSIALLGFFSANCLQASSGSRAIRPTMSW